MSIVVDAAGLQDFARYMQLAPKVAGKAARLAINDTAERKGLKLAREAMFQQVAFPGGYLTETAPNGGRRFDLKYRATDAQLEAGIVGRRSPTSLARFTGRASPAPRGTRLTVQIAPGKTVELPRAFMIRLRNGNLGVGIRLKPGETLRNTVGAKLIVGGPLNGVALLYGPSVDQVFRTVAVDISPPVLEALQGEFLRQFERLFNA
jgi:hypothetical protein